MLIRNYKPSDLEKITEFKRKSSQYSFHGKDIDEWIFRRCILKQIRKDPKSVKIIEDEGEVVGYTWFTIKKTITGAFGVINHIFVEKAHRRKGLGRMLMKLGEDFFRKRGIDTIRITISKDNERSISFCKELDYKEKRIIFEKKI